MKIPLVWRERRTRVEKNDWQDGLRNAIYTLFVSLISPTFFLRSDQFDDKYIAGLTERVQEFLEMVFSSEESF